MTDLLDVRTNICDFVARSEQEIYQIISDAVVNGVDLRDLTIDSDEFAKFWENMLWRFPVATRKEKLAVLYRYSEDDYSGPDALLDDTYNSVEDLLTDYYYCAYQYEYQELWSLVWADICANGLTE